jgi:hypothetical protein
MPTEARRRMIIPPGKVETARGRRIWSATKAFRGVVPACKVGELLTACQSACVSPETAPKETSPWNCFSVGVAKEPADSFEVGCWPLEPGGLPATVEIGTPACDWKFSLVSLVSRWRNSSGRASCAWAAPVAASRARTAKAARSAGNAIFMTPKGSGETGKCAGGNGRTDGLPAPRISGTLGMDDRFSWDQRAIRGA